ncbi:MAG: hemolysin family protein [Halobacteriales archaeon]|nr:hemolysin family protein [Halobacteriales archaeon]
MNATEIGIRLAAGVGLILLNGFFVAIEFALTRARQFSKQDFVDGSAALERAWDMTQELELYLTTCQVGITASSIAVGIVAEPALAALFEPLFAGSALATIGAGALLGYLIINLVHLTHGEQTPTYLGVERSRFVCRWGAQPLHWFYVAISPIIKLGDRIAKGTLRLFGIEMTGAWLETEEDALESRAQLRTRLSDLLEEGELTREHREEVLGALDADERPISDIVVPAGEVIHLSTEASIEENFERIRNTPHTRFPLVEDELESFVGVVYVPSILDHYEALKDGSIDFSEIAAPPMTLAGNTAISEALDQFQAEQQELALVLDGDDVLGLLTATDTLEAIMGDIEDPLDSET